MLRNPHIVTSFIGTAVWLAVVAALAATGLLLVSTQASAQQDATESTLSTPALTAQATAGAIELRWEAVAGAVRYELMVWWEGLTDWQPLEGTTDTSYTHSGLTAGRKYFYTIRAVNAADEKSDWLQKPYASATVPTATARTATPTPTPQPHELTAPALTAQATAGAIELRWEAVAGAVRYELMVWWKGLTDWQSLGGTTGTSYTHSGLTAGRKYYYTIRAVNAAGEKSDWLQKPYASATVPTATATATQKPNAQPQERSPQDPQHTPTPTATPTATQKPNAQPQERSPQDPQHTPTPTATATPTATPTSPPQYSEKPGAPAPPNVVVLGAGHVSVDWDDVPRATYYNLWYWSHPYWRSVKRDAASQGISFTFNGSSAVLTNMPADFPTYKFYVEAQNAVGKSFSASSSATNPEKYRLLPTPTPTLTPTGTPTPVGRPSAPNKPTASMNSDGSVSISWETVPETASYDVWLYHYVVIGFIRRWVRLPYDGVDLGGVNVDGYVREDIRISISGTSATVTNLPSKTTYSFRVRAYNDAGSTFSPSVSVANINLSASTPE